MASFSSLTSTQPASTSTTTTNSPSETTPAPALLRASLKVLHLPELLSSIGQFLSQRDALACVLVCRTWLHAFEPLVWEHIETANKIPAQDLERHACDIRTLSLAGLVGMDGVLKRCTRLETVILWPDAFDEEEDETEEDEEDDGEEVEVEVEEGEEDGDDVEVEVEDEADGDKVQEESDAGQEEDMEFVQAECSGGLQGNAHGEDNALRLLFSDCERSAGRGGAENNDDESMSGSSDIESEDNTGEGVPAGRRETDKEKLRRDSGVGQDTFDAEVAMLGISNASAMTIAGSESLDQQQQQSMAGFWPQNQTPHPTYPLPQSRQRRIVYGSPLASLLLRNQNLRRVEVYVDRKSPGGSFWRALAASPKSTHNCQTVSAPSSCDSTSRRSSFCPCPRLSAFQSLSNLQVHKHIDSFLQMCTRLESLDLERCTLRQLDADGYQALWFPRLRELKFGRIRGMSLLSQLLFMRQCPELEILDWRVPHLGFPVDEFCQALEEGRWPKLTSLTLPESRLTDGELARILLGAASVIVLQKAAVSSSLLPLRKMEVADKAATRLVPKPGSWYALSSSSWTSSMSPLSTVSPTNKLLRCTTTPATVVPSQGLSTFAVRRSDFGPLAFSALKRHFATIQYLDLYQCPALTSPMTQEILMSCPSLESFDGNRLLAEDIAHGLSSVSRRPFDHHSCLGAGASGTSSNQTRQEHDGSTVAGGWACKELRYLDVHITGFSGAGTSAYMDIELGNNNARGDRDMVIQGDVGEFRKAWDHGSGSTKGLVGRQMQWTVFSQLAQLHNLVHLSVGGKSTLPCATTTTTSTVLAAEVAGTPELSSTSPASPSPSPSSSLATGVQVTAAAHVAAVDAREVRCGRGGAGGLDLRLHSGLGQLRTLRKLRMLRFTGLEQRMEQEDVAWMVEQLPELRVLQGRLHSDVNRQTVLEAQLEAGGVSAWTMYNHYS
ncbi:hypothetical protein BGZ68_007782 [Mortierella alpina]|nr:hypothetical protein BGZ68_007782 [Mortierella alpina]